MTCAGGFQRMERCVAVMFKHFGWKPTFSVPMNLAPHEKCAAEAGPLGWRWICLGDRIGQVAQLQGPCSQIGHATSKEGAGKPNAPHEEVLTEDFVVPS